MAENIGKVIVSIEAKVEALETGLAKAEATMKRSADKMAAEQKKLTTKFKKSWTELTSKINVYRMALGAVGKAVKTLDEVTKLWADSTKQTHEQIIGTFDLFSNSGIPIVAEFSQLIQGLGALFSDLDEVQASAAESARYLAEQQSKVRLAIELQRQIEALKLQAEIQRGMLKVANLRKIGESGIFLEYELQRKAMKEGFDIENKALETRLHNEGKLGRAVQGVLDIRKEAQKELLEVNREREQFAHDLWKKQQDEKIGREQKRIDRTTQAEIRAAETIARAHERATNKIVTAKMDLLTRIAVLEAEAEGNTVKAQMIRLEARIKKEKEVAIESGKAATGTGAKAEEAEKQVVRIGAVDKESDVFKRAIQGVVDKYQGAIDHLDEQIAKEGEAGRVGNVEQATAARDELIEKRQRELDRKIKRVGGEFIGQDQLVKELKMVEEKYRKIRAEQSKGTKQQLALIDKAAALERAAIVGSGWDDGDADGDATKTVSTALGSFTVAMASDPVQREQTTLLGRIATSSAMLVNIQKKAKDKEVVLPYWRETSSHPDLFRDAVSGGAKQTKEQEEQTSLLKKIADSNEKVARSLASPTASGIIIAS